MGKKKITRTKAVRNVTNEGSRRKRTTAASLEPTPNVRAARSEVRRGIGLEGAAVAEHGRAAGTTGRMMVVSLSAPARRGKAEFKSMLESISKSTGLGSSSATVCSTSDCGKAGISARNIQDAEVVLLENLGIALLNGDVEQNMASVGMQAGAAADGFVVEPEYINENLGHRVHNFVETSGISEAGPSDTPGLDPTTARALAHILSQLQIGGESPVDVAAGFDAACFQDTVDSTYGLKATNVLASTLSGNGIRVAVLDSGMDLGHPDFSDRSITHQEFVPDNQPDNTIHDINGHGTHCIGTACGPRHSLFGPRYGIAHNAEIFAGKVLAHNFATGRATGGDFGILQGIDWAIENDCHVISMSLGGRATQPTYPQSYEEAASRALTHGSLIIAATGNDSFRPGFIAAVGRPANCPSIAGVAGVDNCLRVYRRSNGRRFFHNGAEVNFTGPGVTVMSSVPRQQGNTGFMTGTSMATPHASGVAALIAEETGLLGFDLYQAVKARCQDLGNINTFGFGLVKA